MNLEEVCNFHQCISSPCDLSTEISGSINFYVRDNNRNWGREEKGESSHRLFIGQNSLSTRHRGI